MGTPKHRTGRSPLRTPLAWLAVAGLSLSAIAIAASAQDQPTPPPADPPPPPPEASAPPEAPDEESDELPEAIVLLKDGQRMSGFLLEQDDERVVLRIAGIKSTIRRDLVERVWVLPPTMERYRSIRAAIDDADAEQLLRLAEWLRARGKYDPALAEVDHVLSLEPDHPEAKRLRVLIVEQKELAEKARATRQAREQEQPAGEPDEARPRPETRPFPLLSGPEINILRVYEIDTNNPPRLLIDRDTITQLMSEHAGSSLIPSTREGREAMYRKRPAEILDIMFRLQARNLYGKVQVLDHPESFRRFRENVHRGWFMNNCATTRCHGGTEAGRLWLHNRRPNSDETVYTNFLILDRFKLPDGTPLINYDEPARSPFLHMGLPREDSLYPHPQVPGASGRGDLWRPVFRGSNDRRYRQAIDWIRAMYRPRPEYPVDYTPPLPPGATEEPPPPATPPAEENPPR